MKSGTRMNQSFHVELIRVHQETNHRTTIVNFPVGRDDNARLGGKRCEPWSRRLLRRRRRRSLRLWWSGCLCCRAVCHRTGPQNYAEKRSGPFLQANRPHSSTALFSGFHIHLPYVTLLDSGDPDVRGNYRVGPRSVKKVLSALHIYACSTSSASQQKSSFYEPMLQMNREATMP